MRMSSTPDAPDPRASVASTITSGSHATSKPFRDLSNARCRDEASTS